MVSLFVCLFVCFSFNQNPISMHQCSSLHYQESSQPQLSESPSGQDCGSSPVVGQCQVCLHTQGVSEEGCAPQKM